MKRLIVFSMLIMASVLGAEAQIGTFINSGTNYYNGTSAPQIDATNFINTGSFVVDLNSVFSTTFSANQFSSPSTEPFSFSDVLNFTNRGFMAADVGFLFNTQPSGTGTAHRASLFGNASGAIISGGVTNSILFDLGTTNLIIDFFEGSVLPTVTVSATNVVNRGIINVGLNGLLTVDGATLDLSRGKMSIAGLNGFDASIGSGIFVDDWGLGIQTNAIRGGSYTLPNAISPSFEVANSLFAQFFMQLSLANTLAKANVKQVDASNVVTQVVLVGNTSSAITTDIRFEPDGNSTAPVVQFLAMVTNNLGAITTNGIYLFDFFGSETNFQYTTNLSILSPTIQLIPFNFDIEVGFFPDYTNLPVGNTPYSPSLLALNGGGETNQYAALGVELDPVTFRPDPNIFGQNLTNIPGRISINADTSLDLTLATIAGPNYLRINSTNHFKGSANAQITSPNFDLNLGTTNGTLVITNLVAPYLARFSGTIDAYSARWTNIVNGVTNEYHLLMVQSQLSPTSLPLVQNLSLRSTNVIISDIINIATNLLINANNLTIQSNAPGSPNPYGELNLQTPNVIWSTSLPVLQNLTNFGILNFPNSVYFAEFAQPPYFTTNFTAPYLSLVNHGSIVSAGDSVWANYFENTGTQSGLSFTNTGAPTVTNQALIYSPFGSINIQASNAVLANDIISTGYGDISIAAGTLLVTNHAMQVQGALTLAVTNTLTDGGAGSSNLWSANDGLNLLSAATNGDFLGTTVTNFAPAGAEVFNTWAGKDEGATVAGFTNNGALGHLILDGGDNNSLFYFNGIDSNPRALYVDLLDLRDGATNRTVINNVENFTAFDFDDNMTIYFADAMLSGFDVSEKMNGANGGHLIWVSSYAGIFSGTNVVYPDGEVHYLNRALVQSTDIDSNTNGIPNAFDPAPIDFPSLSLAVSFAATLPKAPTVSFNTTAGSKYSLYYRTNMVGSDWQFVTNFPAAGSNGHVSYLDHGRTNSSGFYKVLSQP